jgi:hypothetical protein
MDKGDRGRRRIEVAEMRTHFIILMHGKRGAGIAQSV